MSFLFHTEVFVPNRLRKPCFEGRLKYRPHALEESQLDRYGHIALPEFFEADKAKLIEVELGDDCETVLKQVWRQSLDAVRDLVLVITPSGFVKTVWVNLKSDKHRTLNRGRYVKG